jgi:hemolysin activation/secretion protein
LRLQTLVPQAARWRVGKLQAPMHCVLTACAFCLGAGPLSSRAQGLPNAGSLLQTQPPVQKPAEGYPHPTLLPLIAQPAQTESPPSLPFLVRALRLEGNTVFDTATLQALLSPMRNQRLHLAQVYEGIEAIGVYYRAAGYPLAHAILPAQTIEDGVVLVQVVEANWGEVELNNSSPLKDAVLLRTVADLQAGSVVQLAPLERASQLLGELPGVLPQALLRAGQEAGSTDLVLNVRASSPLSANLSTNNFGSRYTGVMRSIAILQWNNPLGLGDKLGLSALGSEAGGMRYARLAYELPVAFPGWQTGGDLSSMQYALGGSASNLQAYGEAQSLNLWLGYALMRTNSSRANARLGVNANILRDHVDSTEVKTDRNVNSWSLSLSGERKDNWLGSGQNAMELLLYAGRVNFQDATGAALDARSAETAGEFARASFTLSRNHYFGNKASALLRMNVQWAQKNLDSSQKFAVGGPGSVRAYRVGVLSGDSGALLSADWHYVLPMSQWLQDTGTWQLACFLDAAQVQTNKNTWDQGVNEAMLSGVGLGLNWYGPKGWSSRFSIATPVGQTPSQIAATDAHQANAWLEVNVTF